MSRKNHKILNGRLIQTDKPFSQLKQQQKEKINEWLYAEYAQIYSKIKKRPDSGYNDDILQMVYDKIEDAGIWLPFAELKKYFFAHKSKYGKQYEKQQNIAEG